MPESSDQFWDSAQKCHDAFPLLLVPAEQYLARLPEITLLVKKRDRVEPKRSFPRLSKRASLLYDRRDGKVEAFYREFGTFVEEVRAILMELRNVFAYGEAERLESEIGRFRIEATCRVVQQAARRLDEFWECRNNERGVSSDFARGRRGRRGPKPADHQSVKEIVELYGDAWRDELAEIALKLDEKGVPVPKPWTTDRKLKSFTWARGIENYRRAAVQAIEYRIKMAAR